MRSRLVGGGAAGSTSHPHGQTRGLLSAAKGSRPVAPAKAPSVWRAERHTTAKQASLDPSARRTRTGPVRRDPAGEEGPSRSGGTQPVRGLSGDVLWVGVGGVTVRVLGPNLTCEQLVKAAMVALVSSMLNS